VNRFSCGRSVAGREIAAFACGDGPTLALVHAGIHGDEPGAPIVAERLVAALDGWRGPRVVIVPAVNPDGLTAGTKDNGRGVDLNRNFPSRSYRPGVLAPGYDAGPAPLSEPESAALAALVDAERPRRIVAVHQPFRCVNFDGPARPLAERMAAACGWPVVEDVGYPTPGSFGARYGVDLGLEVITLELPRPATEDELAAGLAALRIACTLP